MANGDEQYKGNEAESAIAVANFDGRSVVSVAYNDYVGSPYAFYSATDRIVRRGASMFGWSYSEDGGASFRYGGKVPATEEWPVFWGDPSIATSLYDQRYVFMTSLAVPAHKFPPSGEIRGGIGGQLGGACIARSSDGGKSFALWTCVNSNYDFYDGASTVAGSNRAGGDRRVFVAFLDVGRSQIHVWQADSEVAGEFHMLPIPFGSEVIQSHPRLRMNPATGELYVAAKNAGHVVVGSIWNGASWSGMRRLSDDSGKNGHDIAFAHSAMRTGAEFSFDVGPASDASGADAVRVFTTSLRDDGSHYIKATSCDRRLEKCSPFREWSTFDQRGDQYQPAVTAFQGLPFFGIPGEWQLTYLTRSTEPNGDSVELESTPVEGNASVGRRLRPKTLVSLGYVCPDTRGGSPGYWGDYNDMALLDIDSNKRPRFIRTFTSSDKSDFPEGCYNQQAFTSDHVHLKAIRL